MAVSYFPTLDGRVVSIVEGRALIMDLNAALDLAGFTERLIGIEGRKAQGLSGAGYERERAVLMAGIEALSQSLANLAGAIHDAEKTSRRAEAA